MSPRLDGLVRDRDGELIEPPTEHYCTGGWIGDEATPQPCPVCRPATAQRVREQYARRRARDLEHDAPEPTPSEGTPMTSSPAPAPVTITLDGPEDLQLVLDTLAGIASTAAETAQARAVDLMAEREGGRDVRTKTLRLAEDLARASAAGRIADSLRRQRDEQQTTDEHEAQQ